MKKLSVAILVTIASMSFLGANACPGMKTCPAGAKCGDAKAQTSDATTPASKDSAVKAATTTSESKTVETTGVGAGTVAPEAKKAN